MVFIRHEPEIQPISVSEIMGVGKWPQVAIDWFW